MGDRQLPRAQDRLAPDRPVTRDGVSVEPPSAALARIEAPVLLITASNNEEADALEEFKRAQPGARVEVLDSGHNIPEDAPEETVRLVAEFLG